MAKAKRASKSYSSYYSQYKSTSRWSANRKRKLERQLKLQPNNSEQIKAAILNIKYRRHTPKTTPWSHQNIQFAKLFKEFTGHAPLALFSNNQKLQQQALQLAPVQKSGNDRVLFSLAARAHDGRGNRIWK
jgi:hypothetical protein